MYSGHRTPRFFTALSRRIFAPLRRVVWVIVLLDCTPWSLEAAVGGLSTADLAATTKRSIAVVSHFARDGREDGQGTGFVVGEGLIATSLHVIGESRPVTVRLADGSRHEALSIHAWDRHADLAVIRIAVTNLPSLPLGDSDSLAQGQEVVAIGNPMGLQHSVVEGVLSGRRTFDGVELLQVALPIEQGNSGGPLMDRNGRVHGVVNMKSALTRNLGFATPSTLLKALLDRPNPVPMSRWLSFASIQTNEWHPKFGARWRQKGHRILVDGLGNGFGGRSLLVATRPVPAPTYEVAVTVKLDDESGAAGLIFASDGGDRHYGFYPTGGQLRLTRFDGPEVFSWSILTTVPSPHYRRGEWNRVRVRVEQNRLLCFVNEELVVESADKELTGGSVGLAKFRDTSAEFRDFTLGNGSSSGVPGISDRVASELGLGAIAATKVGVEDTLKPETWSQLLVNAAASRQWLTTNARELEQAATRLRSLATRVHRDSIRDELVQLMGGAEEQLDLFRAAMLIARHDNPDLDVESYRAQLDRLAQEMRERITGETDGRKQVENLVQFLFAENGFHGSRHDYYDRANSYMNDVMDDREGLPITLSVLFLEVARRAGISHVSGVPLPGHFLVKYAPPGADEQLIDVFNGGRFITHTEADDIGSSAQGLPVRSEFLKPATKREILNRMLTNLQSFTERTDGPAESLRYLDLLIAVAADKRSAAAHRVDRSRVRFMTGDREGAREDLKWVLDQEPSGIDLERVSDMIRRLDR